ncbi:hypothetical protein BDQ17DRAFT_1253959, partial [Cyathus striatus]
LVYPSIRALEGQVPCSLLLINTAISSNTWAEVPINSSDITAVHLHLDGGCTLFIFNIYLACTHNDTLHPLVSAMREINSQLLSPEES